MYVVRTPGTPDFTTGNQTQTFERVTIRRVFTDVVSLAQEFQVKGTKLTVSGDFQVGDRVFILDARFLPGIAPNMLTDYIEFLSELHTIVHMESIDPVAGWILVGRTVKGDRLPTTLDVSKVDVVGVTSDVCQDQFEEILELEQEIT